MQEPTIAAPMAPRGRRIKRRRTAPKPALINEQRGPGGAERAVRAQSMPPAS
jgi:hypothetical protein